LESCHPRLANFGHEKNTANGQKKPSWASPPLSRPPRTVSAFVEQSLADTEAVIDRLFEALPQVNVVSVRVFDQTSGTVIISGTVSRADVLARDEELSIGMRLRYLGLTYHSAGYLFEALDESHRSVPVANAGGAPEFRTEEYLVKAMYRRDIDAP
jgi:hypothetical protein